VGPRTGLDGCGKSHLPPGLGLRTVQNVASRYIDYAIPTHDLWRTTIKLKRYNDGV
jgi:hypothetical protein